MTSFTTNDPIFALLKDTPGLDQTALLNLVDALNQNSHANATFSAAAQRGDVVIQLVAHDVLKNDGAGARFSNDRGSDSFVERGNKFAIQLDQDWFIPRATPQGMVPATFTQPQAVNSALGMVTHEADHSNRQSLYDEAYKLGTTSPDGYRPDLTGAARVAASVDLTMKAEVAGWYADLNTLRAEVDIGHVSKGQYNAYVREGTINAKLIAIEQQGKAQGLTGNALTEYVTDHAKEAIPASYATRYTDAYTPAGIDKIEVRGILAYALNGAGQIQAFAEEIGPEGTYVSIATYNNGERITTIYDGVLGRHSEAKEALQFDGTYRRMEERVVNSYNSDGSFGDETATQYFADGQIWRVSETDGSGDNSDYGIRTTSYDPQGRIDSIDVRRDDGTRDTTDYDQNSTRLWSRIESRFDAQGREDYTTTFIDDGSRIVHDYDQTNVRGDRTSRTHIDAQGRTDRTYVIQDDGSVDSTDYDQTSVRGDSTWQTHIDAQGRTDWTYVTQDDGSTDWTDYDQSNVRGDSTWQTHVDAQGRTDWTDVIRDDGSRDWTDYDQAGARGDSTTQMHFDAQGRTDWTDVVQDDGSRDWTDYDQTNVRGDSISQSHTDAQGRLDWTYVTQDDGSYDWADYDQTNERGDSISQSHTDAQGRTDWTYVTLDDGSRDWTDFDQNNERGDSIWQNRVDAWGREDRASITFDDGSRNWYDYDQDGSQGWNRVESRFDAWGREDYAIVYSDNGGRDRHDYDQDGSQAWREVLSHFDAMGREAHANVYLDDGSRDWHDYDQTGDQAWREVLSHFDPQGREDYANIYMDDGSRNAYDYDQDGSQRWSRIESHFGANGRAEYATTYFDDGSRVVVDHDYYQFGDHQIVQYDGLGRSHLVGSMMDRFPGLVFPAAGGVVAFDGTVLATPQNPNSPGASSTAWIPTDTGAICGIIETPWGTYVDCA